MPLSSPDADVVLMDASRIRRSIRRMALQIAEEYHNDAAVTLLGINTRGFAVASRLRDELVTLLPQTSLARQVVVDAGSVQADANAEDFDDRTVFVVDDVIFSGRTMQQAVNFVMLNYHPETVRCVALVDRGHRTFPVEPYLFGLICPTKLREHVHVDLIPEAATDNVLLFRKNPHLA